MLLSEYLAQLCAYLNTLGLTLTEQKDINYGVQLRLSDNVSRFTLRVYQNKAGRITLDTSPLRDEALKAKLSAFSAASSPDAPAAKHYPLASPPLIGSDESGKGDYFGALVVAAVYADEEAYRELEKLGVRDSKLLTDDTMQKMSAELLRICPNRAIIQINPRRLNELHASGKNLNVLLGAAHAQAVASVYQKTNCKNILCDKFGAEHHIADNLAGYDLNITQAPRAEQNAAVAAASILARCQFVKMLHSLEEKYACELPLGAGSGVDRAAKAFLRRHGEAELGEIAKIFFKNTEKIK